MVEIRKPITVNEAITRVMERCQLTESTTISLQDSYGYTLVEPIRATHNVPPFNRSPYDGYAIRSQDTTGANKNHEILFTVIDQIGAGYISNKVLQKNEAVRIMTGAPLPEGSDAIVMFEQAMEDGVTFTIRQEFKRLENVSTMAEDAEKGEMLIHRGSIIHPGTVALLATFGYSQVAVARKPIVGILSTGSELINIAEDLRPGKIRDSNGPMIVAQLARMGIDSRVYGIMADDIDSCYEMVCKAMEETDCVITTGGVSVGDFDYLPEIYKKLEAEVLFNKVAMRPGSVTTVAYVAGKLLFGLSGNPSACFTAFELFVRPALLSMMGNKRPYLPYTEAVLMEEFSEANPFTRFIRSIYSFDGTKSTITPAGFNKTNAVSSIAKGNAMMVLPGSTEGYAAGEQVGVLLLGVEDGAAQWNLVERRGI